MEVKKLMPKPRKHGAHEKLEVALAAIKGELTIAQISSRYKLHATQIVRWKKQALEAIKGYFSGQFKLESPDKHTEEELAKLYEKIGRLNIELDWMKKKSEFNG